MSKRRKTFPDGVLSLPRECWESEQRAYQVLSRTYGGIYHVEGWGRRQAWGIGVAVTERYHDLATFDFSDLTCLVVFAHEECVRLEIEACAPRTLRLIFHARRRKGPEADEIWSYHPTLNQALKTLKRAGRYKDMKEPS